MTDLRRGFDVEVYGDEREEVDDIARDLADPMPVWDFQLMVDGLLPYRELLVEVDEVVV